MTAEVSDRVLGPEAEYAEAVARHFHAPANRGTLDAAHALCAEAGRRERGLWIRIQMTLEAGRVDQVAWQALGCPHTVALLSMASEGWQGRRPDELLPLDAGSLVRELALPPEKRDRLLLLEDALAAIGAEVGRRGGSAGAGAGLRHDPER